MLTGCAPEEREAAVAARDRYEGGQRYGLIATVGLLGVVSLVQYVRDRRAAASPTGE